MLRKLNWPAWLGLLVSLFAFLSYPFLFVNWAATRDFPWINLALCILAVVLLVLGIRRALAPGRRLLPKISVGLLTIVSLLAMAMLVLMFFVGGRLLPASTGAPQVNRQAPEFTLIDSNNKPVTLTELLTQPIDGRPAKGVLLIFYRGYW